MVHYIWYHTEHPHNVKDLDYGHYNYSTDHHFHSTEIVDFPKLEHLLTQARKHIKSYDNYNEATLLGSK